MDIIDNQNFIITVKAIEKWKYDLIQVLNSLSTLIGYQRNELINKPLKMLIPSIFIDGQPKKVSDYIKRKQMNKNLDEEYINEDKNKHFILTKNKMGYQVALNAKYSFSNDNDFSNNLIIKALIELRDSKSIYAYYLLTKTDFILESISASTIQLGLTIDLLKII